MTLEQFIKANRQLIDTWILELCPNMGGIDDRERELWVLNSEGLYTFALREGVREI